MDRRVLVTGLFIGGFLWGAAMMATMMATIVDIGLLNFGKTWMTLNLIMGAIGASLLIIFSVWINVHDQNELEKVNYRLSEYFKDDT